MSTLAYKNCSHSSLCCSSVQPLLFALVFQGRIVHVDLELIEFCIFVRTVRGQACYDFHGGELIESMLIPILTI